MYTFIAIVALLVMLYCIATIGWCATREPLTPAHREQIARAQSIYTVILIVAAIVLGLSLENLLP